MSRLVRISILLFAAFWLSACSVKLYSVQLNPVGNKGELKVLTPSNRCPESRNPHDGCMLFKKDKVGLITFHLPGSELVNKTCASPDTNRVITRIQLTARGASNDPIAEKGDFGTPMGLKELKREAFLNLNPATGDVFIAADVSEGRTQVRLVNNNSNEYVKGLYKAFWYRVTVTKCDDPAVTWVTDPRGDNEGSWD